WGLLDCLDVSGCPEIGMWRRDRDSNPGYLAVYTLSKRAPSATRPSLRNLAGLFESNTTARRAMDGTLSLRCRPETPIGRAFSPQHRGHRNPRATPWAGMARAVGASR